jgi:hypothetical protein
VQSPAAREVLTRLLTGHRHDDGHRRPGRAARRGAAGTDSAEIIRTVTALIYYRLFIAGEQPCEALADSVAAIAAIAAAAARAGAGHSARSA